MKSHGRARDLSVGRDVWKPLEKVINRGHDRHRVFSAWLDLMLTAHLSLTDNLKSQGAGFDLAALDGPYEERYRALVSEWADTKPRGERVIDLMADAYGALIAETERERRDVLGEIYMACISYGEHGQFFTPHSLGGVMASVLGLENGARVLDPTCGSGTLLIEAGKTNPTLHLTGYDLDSRCARMCALNLLLFGFQGRVREGNSLIGEFYRQWDVLPGGAIFEQEFKPALREMPAGTPKQKPTQGTLLAA